MNIIDLFKNGNYALVVEKNDQNLWQTYAAMGLIGKTQEALAGLATFTEPEVTFYTAVTHWIAGDDEKAAYLLKGIALPVAQNLYRLISKPQIEVLAQLPWNRSAPHDILKASTNDSKFIVRNISFHPDDLQNQPYADIHTFYNPQTPPDFYACMMVEWHLIPPNLQDLPCPIIGQTGDYDLHIQAVYPWLQLFDEFIVTDHTEWNDVTKLVRVPVSTFPKSFGLSVDLSPIPNLPRDIDVFVSGTTLHPYHPDKVELYHQVLRIPNINPCFVNGFMSKQQYYDLLSRSKLCFTHVRHGGATPTRGLEALSMGSVVAVQKDCVLQLFAGEQEGVIAYDHDDLTTAIQTVLSRWSEFEAAAQRGAKLIRSEFALPKVASQYLRFLTFIAAKPREKRHIQPIGNLYQKRSILQKGWLPGGKSLFGEMRKQNLIRWRNIQLEVSKPSLFIDMARELVLAYAHENESFNTRINVSLLNESLEIYREGLKKFPESLVLIFNFIRVALHFGQSHDISEALELATKIVNIPVTEWHIDLMDDVFPWDVFSQFFDYRRYFDLVTEAIADAHHNYYPLVETILASIYFYLANNTANRDQSVEYLSHASTLNPNFAFFVLPYAEQLVTRNQPNDLYIAETILVKLANNSILFVEAYELLLQIQIKKIAKIPELVKIHNSILQAERYTILLENLGNRYLESSPSFISVNSELEAKYNITLHRNKSYSPKIQVSIILVDWKEDDICAVIVEQFFNQTVTRDQYEIIWVGLQHQTSFRVLSEVDIAISIDCHNKHTAYNIGILNSNSPIIVMCDNDVKPSNEFVANVVKAFNLDLFRGIPEIVLTSSDQTYVAFRKIDAIRLGGFDEARRHCSIYHLANRLIYGGIRQRYHSQPILKIINHVSWDFWNWQSDHCILLPRKENLEIQKLRTSLHQFGSLFNQELLQASGLASFSTRQRIKLHFSLIFLDTFILERGLGGILSKPVYIVKAQILIGLRALIGNQTYTYLKRSWHFLRGKDKV